MEIENCLDGRISLPIIHKINLFAGENICFLWSLSLFLSLPPSLPFSTFYEHVCFLALGTKCWFEY